MRIVEYREREEAWLGMLPEPPPRSLLGRLLDRAWDWAVDLILGPDG